MTAETATTTAALSCQDLSAGYDRACVRGVSLRVAPGEVVALLGPNGAGKTTLLMTLAGLLPRLGGTVAIGGKTLASGRARAAVRAGLVLVPDDRSLFAGLSVSDNLRLAGSRGATLDLVFDYFPALRERRRVHAGMLSGGEQQMLAIGRALMQRPKLLLIDELSMGLAPVIVESLLPVLRTVADDQQVGMVLVEQHVALALDMADRGMVIAHGDVVLEGGAKELAADSTALERAYLGRATAVTL